MPETYHKARRAHSLPSAKYMIPSAEMGEYENIDGRRRSAPAGPNSGNDRNQHSRLYPLDEEGTYGQAPIRPATSYNSIRKDSFSRRDRKPKVYSSYSVDSNCSLHAKKSEKKKNSSNLPPQHGTNNKKKSSTSSLGSRSSSSPGTGRRDYSLSPDRGFGSGSSNTTGSRSSSSPEPNNRRRSASTVSGYSSTTTTSNGQQQHHYSSYSRNIRGSSFEEKEEYDYQESQDSKVGGGLSLNSLRMPKIDTWDAMGILGLTSKMWNDTKKRQESFMESTGHFLREERDSYIM